MPANLTPQYHKAEEAFKAAKTAEEKLAALDEMLAVIPKHKGTDHLQADLKRKRAELREEASRPGKSKKAFDPFRIESGGAGQVVLLGPPNAGKSAIVAHLSNARTEATPFPFATQGPIPGMMPFEDVQVQLVDLPPITADFFPPGMLGLIKSADAALLLADLGSESVLEDLEAVVSALEKGRLDVCDPRHAATRGGDGEEEAVAERLPGLLLGMKVDLPGAADRLEILRDLYGGRFDPLPISTETSEGLDVLPGRVFGLLDRIRVYSKEPGKPPDRTSPFVLRRGETVLDLAAKVHRDFPEHLQQARVWGSARFDGQAVRRDYALVEGDVVELLVDL